MRYILPILALAYAATATAAPQYTYQVDGKAADTKAALAAAMRGATVLRCQPVEAAPNKSGTSIGLKAKKAKPAS